MAAEAALAHRPSTATTNISLLSISVCPGELMRTTAWTAIHAVTAMTATALTRAAITSTRRCPKVARSVAARLPISAATNLDALLDALRDLDLWWPRTRRIALLWRAADVIEQADPEGFGELVQVLSTASQELWRADREPGAEGDEHDRLLRVMLLPSTATSEPVDPTAPAVQ